MQPVTSARIPLIVAILLSLALGLGACTLGRDAVSRRQTNLAKQKEVALIFRKNYPAVEKIRFTREGNEPGLGAPWSVNAVVTLEGKEYEEILGFLSIGGEPMPDVDPPSPQKPTLVIFSDGTTEEIE